jgi:hypothetical protein
VDQILADEAVDGGTADLVQWTLTDHLNTVRDIASIEPKTVFGGVPSVGNRGLAEARASFSAGRGRDDRGQSSRL